MEEREHANQPGKRRGGKWPRGPADTSRRLSDGKEVGKRSDCQFDLGGQVLTDTTNFESALQEEDGDAGRTRPPRV